HRARERNEADGRDRDIGRSRRIGADRHSATVAARPVPTHRPDVAVTTASFVCQGKAAGMPNDQLTTYVNAMAGSDPAYDPAKMPVEQAGKIYVDVATQTYCDK
uniref:DUF732 domain-containing protein n=1 Tax=Nocardia wallacei TaxID=480035 RepID=UPI0024581168